jgi:hypothetical protein
VLSVAWGSNPKYKGQKVDMCPVSSLIPKYFYEAKMICSEQNICTIAAWLQHNPTWVEKCTIVASLQQFILLWVDQ